MGKLKKFKIKPMHSNILILYTRKYLPPFYFVHFTLPSLSVGEFKIGRITMSQTIFHYLQHCRAK